MELFKFSKKKRMQLYEYCTRCDANLTLQKGYSNTLPFWNCRGCGQLLVNPSIKTESNVSWICDECGCMLNIQPGFTEKKDEWECTECGFVNSIRLNEIYSSEDEFQASRLNPLKGLEIEEVLDLYSYEEIRSLGEKSNVMLVRNKDDNCYYVKKLLSTYDVSIYEYLMQHPFKNMPQVKRLYHADNYLILIEEYIEGCVLSDLLSENVMSIEQTVKIVKQICKILASLHNSNRPIIHRDIKPSNIILTKEDSVYLLDMNVAKWYKPEEIEDTRLLGTMHFAAPEQLGYGFSASSDKTDIYAIGILMNIMLTNKLPKEKKAEGVLWDLIERCISLEPEKRPSAKELIHELDKSMRT